MLGRANSLQIKERNLKIRLFIGLLDYWEYSWTWISCLAGQEDASITGSEQVFAEAKALLE